MRLQQEIQVRAPVETRMETSKYLSSPTSHDDNETSLFVRVFRCGVSKEKNGRRFFMTFTTWKFSFSPFSKTVCRHP
jgi:hypothetical protein